MSDGEQKEIWWNGDSSDFDDDTVEEVKEKGNRISVSKLESLVPLYDAYLEKPNGGKLFEVGRSLMVGKEQDDYQLLKNAESAIYGTQIHQLQYITQLFDRCEALWKEPGKEDFSYTFGFKSLEYYKSLERISKLTPKREGFTKAENFWLTWRLNGHDFSPKSNNYKRISPSRVKSIWENEELAMRILNDFRKGRENMKLEDINPERVMLMNEGMLITNIDFQSRSMQLISTPDEIRVPKDFPTNPVHIIDYKTGYQFKKPGRVEKLQIFLMKVGVLANILSKQKSITFSQSVWELAHNTYRLPNIQERDLLNKSIEFLHESDLRAASGDLDSYIKFSYVNPATQRSIDVTDQDLGIVGENNSDKMIDYIKGLNEFYGKQRKLLNPLLKRRSSEYSLPTFPYEGFEKSGEGNKLEQKDFQESLF